MHVEVIKLGETEFLVVDELAIPLANVTKILAGPEGACIKTDREEFCFDGPEVSQFLKYCSVNTRLRQFDEAK